MSKISEDGFGIGTCVVLQGLKAMHLNGQRAKVATTPTSSNGGATLRQGVDLLNPWKDPQTGQLKNDRLMVKVENLTIDKRTVLHDYEGKQGLVTNCWNCSKSDDHKLFMVCSKCRFAQYCSKDCQVAHWHSCHKAECKSVRASWKNPELTSNDPVERFQQEDSYARKLLDRGNYSQAETHFKAAIEALKPGQSATSYGSLGMSLVFQQKFDEALTVYEKACSLIPAESRLFDGAHNRNLSKVYSNFGSVCGQTGDYEGSVQKFKMAVELDPLCGHHYHGLAISCKALGRFREAAEANEKFIHLCPDYEFLGMAYVVCAQNIREDLFENHDAYSPAEQKRQEAKAQEMLSKAFKIDPNLPFFEELSEEQAKGILKPE